MIRIFRLVDNLRESDSPVLFTGERGVGKQALARAVHLRSLRWARPFVSVSCDALPAAPLQANAFEQRLALARGGTLCLTNVDALPSRLQERLLGEFTTTAPFRPMATTTLPAAAFNATGALAPQLSDLLRSLVIAVPPLRERREDIEPLAIQVLLAASAAQGRVVRCPDATLDTLRGYDWPGNVGELRRAIEYGVAVCATHDVEPDDLPPGIRTSDVPRQDAAAAVRALIGDDKGATRARLLATLESHQWRRVDTARALGISRATLWRRMRDAGL